MFTLALQDLRHALRALLKRQSSRGALGPESCRGSTSGGRLEVSSYDRLALATTTPRP